MSNMYHLERKATNTHSYYGGLAGLFEFEKDLGVSIHTLYRFDFSKNYENDKVIIRQGFLVRSPNKVKE